MTKTKIGIDGEIAWENSMMLGCGYDVENLQTTPFASIDLEIESNHAPEGVEKIRYGCHIIRIAEELKIMIIVSARASAPTSSAFPLEAFSGYLHIIQCNVIKMTTIIRYIVTSRLIRYLLCALLSYDAKRKLKRIFIAKSTPNKFFHQYK